MGQSSTKIKDLITRLIERLKGLSGAHRTSRSSNESVLGARIRSSPRSSADYHTSLLRNDRATVVEAYAIIFAFHCHLAEIPAERRDSFGNIDR